MKPVSPAFEAMLMDPGRNWFVANLYTFMLSGGGVLRYCSGDADVIANGFTYPAGAPIVGPFFDTTLNRAVIQQSVGVQVDTLTFDVLPGTSTLFGVPFIQAVRTGLFRGAELTLEKAFMEIYDSKPSDTAMGTVPYFVGRVGEVFAGRTVVTFNVNSHLELLNMQMPRNLYQPGCVNNLGDASCTVNLAFFTGGGTVTSATNGLINATITVVPAGFFDLGKVIFTTGLLVGQGRTVKTATVGSPSTIQLLGPFPSAPQPGDQFSISAGCDKTLNGGNGCAKFANQINFRGFPFIPQPPTAI